ncbi:STAS/SEC14 domain-containing protein [Flavobacterium sp. WW92]|uniref:STAS/SEC14 domain-containing protein n=1 Tax=unclassified Flavobacterium TaxID=196869 RepID=UPI0022251E7D|nr:MULTISPECIES: STAS/SEC14 domain-containing protein [unclassified Flavobacterium]WDO12472.1 STAS/SEC14 domain-containing protein [Flavobacterium sp. WW92]
MIEQIHNLPDNMVGFRSSGEVTQDDFKLVNTKVSELVQKTGKLNYLLYLENSPADFTFGAWIQDALLGIKNITKWNRAAIISDSETVDKFTYFFSKIMPGEFKVFHKNDLERAIEWTSEKIDVEE